MTKRLKAWLLIWALVLMVALGACGGEDESATAGFDAAEDAVAEESVAEIEQEQVVEPTEEVVVEPTPEPVAEMVEEIAMVTEPELNAAFVTMLSGMLKYNTIGLDALNEQLIEDPPPFVLDVRQPEELAEKGHIEGAVHIPLRELGANLDLLPTFDTPIISYCGSGWRCTIAVTALGVAGWDNVLSLKGGSFGGLVEGGYPAVEGPAAEPMSLKVAQPDALAGR